ncbi:hypothetical protein D0Z08_11350 [Nocardioides immobilis]|uniref:Neutral metalloprotease n=1 Tax=Nocardioides immobilis TaxID=2049295 RepID=A0A417Y2J8_9ACTN|nr:hypothetical protein D0Z08_11350 [Nocardioides immobilis]
MAVVRLSRTAVALFLSIALGLTLYLPLGPAVGGTGAAADPSGDPRSLQAKQVLADVQALLDGLTPQPSADPLEDGRSLTLALRDLRVLKEALPAAEQTEAEQILMRPGQPGDDYITQPLPLVRCAAVICVHYTERGNHAPRGSDGDPATTPSYIRKVRRTLQHVNDKYVAAGYRRPKADGGRGGQTDKVDVYIGDIGNEGLYGYCTSDDPNNPRQTGDYSVWAYCTLDDDYAAGEFPTNTPLENMRVTAAHEYFHAVQFGYDAYEDGWILESTATWAEDELFDKVNDNRNYLADSPLSAPRKSLDRFGGLYHYGAWIWWRYLTEEFQHETGGLPDLVLDVWRKLDGTPGAPNLYSTRGLARVLVQRETRLKREFALFSAANRHPASAYSEGGSRAYRPAAPAASVAVGPGARNPDAIDVRRNHLSSATVRFTPRETDQDDWRLRLALDLPRPARGSAAVVLLFKQGGGVRTEVVDLDATGAARTSVPFSTGAVRRVEVVLVNASTRFDCWKRTPFSCQGEPLDDDRRLTVDARAFRR